MPAPPRRLRSCIAACAAALMVCLLPAFAQQPEPAKAVKLPDGTIVFLTKSPDAADPPLDGVLLSPQEYKTLLEQLDQFKALKANPKALPPSRCQITGKVEQRGERAIAVLSLVYQFRTTAPRSLIALGTRGAFPIAAKLGDGKLPILRDSEDGLALLVETAGDHSLTLEVEVPVGPRGAKGEPGFEITLPRAAITTLALTPPTGVKKVAVGVRTAIDRPSEFKFASEDVAALTAKPDRAGYPLGPAETLNLTWDAPTTAPNAVDGAVTSEAEVTVRVSDSQIETVAVLRLRGSAKEEWTFVFPLGAVVSAERAGTLPKDADPPFAAPSAVVRQPDPTKPVWTFQPPEGMASDWLVTAVVRQPRPKASDAKSRGPFAVGPFAVPTAARQSGTIKLFAPPTIALRVKPGPEVHRPEATPPEDELRDHFKFVTVVPTRQPPPHLELVDVRPAPPVVRMQPTFALRPSDGGWRLDATLAITPVRTEVSEVIVELPPGWQGLEVSPADLVDAVQEGKDTPTGRQYAVQLATAQKAFTLTLSANFVVDLASTQKATLPLPRFPGLSVQNAKVTATVPDGLVVSGTATTTDRGARELKSTSPPPAKPSAVTAVSGQFDKGVTRVDLAWQPHRPELAIDVLADVTVNERQLLVKQVIRVRSPEGEPRPIEFVGPLGALGLRTMPSQDQPSANAWKLRPPPDGREFTQTVTYALPIPPRRADQPLRVNVGLFWTTAATRTEATVRILGGSGRRIARHEGPWRELPPEPIAERDSLPWLTLAGTGTEIPLTLELADADGTLPTTTVERTLIQSWIDADGKVGVRGRFLLRRWSASGVEVEIPPGVAPEFSVDGKKVDPVGSATSVRLPLPEPKPGGAALLLDVRYLLPLTHTGYGELRLPPPRLPMAVFRTPVRWQVALAPDAVALSFDRTLQSDLRWAWRSGLLSPTAGATTAELDQWLLAGAEPDTASEGVVVAGTDALTARQLAVGEVRLVRVPRVLWVVACSLVALLAGLAVSRVRPLLLGPALGLAGLAIVIVAMTWPQPTAHAAGAALPGVAALVLVLAAVATVKWHYRRRITHLPGFTRGLPEPPSKASGSAVVIDEVGSSRPPLASTGS